MSRPRERSSTPARPASKASSSARGRHRLDQHAPRGRNLVEPDLFLLLCARSSKRNCAVCSSVVMRAITPDTKGGVKAHTSRDLTGFGSGDARRVFGSGGHRVRQGRKVARVKRAMSAWHQDLSPGFIDCLMQRPCIGFPIQVLPMRALLPARTSFGADRQRASNLDFCLQRNDGRIIITYGLCRACERCRGSS